MSKCMVMPVEHVDEINRYLTQAKAILELLRNDRDANASQVNAAWCASDLLERAKSQVNSLWHNPSRT